ncbi:MAG: multicopper oxidase domain-containing protein [Alphaproteobacteria bacterium]|nr:multicopper oxidase domain-containing protein [Alphaproteobacteria bacterium]
MHLTCPPLLRRATLFAALATVPIFAANAGGFDIPTGAPPSPLTFSGQTVRPFSQEMLLFEEFGTKPVPGSTCPSCSPMPVPATCTDGPQTAALDTFLAQPLWPQPTRAANTTQANPWQTRIGGCIGRALSTSAIEGRPDGEWFAHQRWDEFSAKVYFQSAQAGARTNGGLRDTLQRHRFLFGEFKPGGLYYRGGTNKNVQVRFHPLLPEQQPNSVWTFDGTMPPKLLMARYGEPILFRHFNALPIDIAANNGFGRHTITTHEHNGHNPAESDGFTAAYFFPGQYYDYHWPMQLAGRDSINTSATDSWAGYPDGAGGVVKIPGDWHETMSTHWFHDHMLDYTAQNVYKGNAAMMNYYSAIDRGREGFQCNYANGANPNLCLPSGTALDWGNRDYDVNLVIADKAWDANGQLFFNIFNTDGFLGDRVLTNWGYKPYFNVRARRYRFRILNGAVSRYFKIAIVTASGQRVPFHMIANDGNIMQNAIRFPNAQSQDLPTQAIAERYDIVVDFKNFAPGTKLYMVNLLEHKDGKGPNREIPLVSVLSGSYQGDPAVGKFLEFRIAAMPVGAVDRSMNPVDYEPGKKTMIPLPTITAAELSTARHRTFEFGRSGGTDEKPWTIKTDGGQGLAMDPHRISADVTKGALEIWHIKNGGGGWSHPVHVHFEEGKILARGGATPPLWEQGARKDVYRVGDEADSTSQVDIAIRFREFMGTFVEHCHNTQHEDNAMLLRWDIKNPGQVVAIPTPVMRWEGTFYEPSFGLVAAGSGTSGAP